MPRPRVDETTLEAIERMASRQTEFDVTQFDTDTQIRIILHNEAKRRIGNDARHPLETVVELTDPYDV